MKLPEVLAPAGSLEALTAAVNAGADAVYIGAKEFNARQRGANFDEKELKEGLSYCHARGVKLYATVNILIKEEELERAVALCETLYDLGMDGIIVQDLGLAMILHQRLPEFSLHSSTQMFVHGFMGVDLLEELGFNRVVLARELTLEEIASIKERAKGEIKIFCHGALCISYSGQCTMSSMIGGRSGNRGRCAQPCRKLYSLYNREGTLVKKGLLISPKDLNTLDLLPELVKTGVDSLKIEGRLKNLDYVHGTVRAYREGLDRIVGGESSKENKTVHEIFNRMYTEGYLKNPDPSTEELMVPETTQRHRLLIGEIQRVEGYRYRFTAAESVRVGDGILIEGEKGSFGETLSTLYDQKGQPTLHLEQGMGGYLSLHRRAAKGDRIFKTSDGVLRDELVQDRRVDRSRKQGFTWVVRLQPESFPEMTVSYQGIERILRGDQKVSPAKNAPLTREKVLEQLTRLGDTPFEAEKLILHMDESSFLPVSALNQLRRQTVEALNEMVAQGRQRTTIILEPWQSPKDTLAPRPEHRILAVRVRHLERLEEAFASTAGEILFGWDDPVDEKILEAAGRLADQYKKTYRWVLPRILRETTLAQSLPNPNLLRNLPVHGLLVGSYEGIQWARKHGFSFETDEGLNVFNSQTLIQLKALGADLAYLSAELNASELEAVARRQVLQTGLVVHGKKELMLLQYGLGLKGDGEGFTLEDPKGFSFPILKDGFQRTHLFNAKTLCLLDELQNLQWAGKLRIDLLHRGDSLQEIVASYDQALQNPSAMMPTWFQQQMAQWTKGHFNRGVL